MVDSVRYEMPFGIFGQLAHAIRVRHDLDRIFDYRAQTISRVFRDCTQVREIPD
jgi:ligand-binding SRPBCC domain-containing protein